MIDTPKLKTEAEAVAAIAREAKVIDLRRNPDAPTPVLIVPDGYQAFDAKPFFDEYLTAPERRTGTAKMNDLPSFIAHTNRFKDEHSALFADRNVPSLTCVLDYHEQSAKGSARFGTHRSRYEFPLSDEWSAWVGSNGKKMGQADFAAFIEDRITDVAAPDEAKTSQALKALLELLGTSFASPSKLLELSRGLSVREGTSVKNAINLSTGETQVTYATAQSGEDGGPLKVPGAFLIAIPVFQGGALYRLAARLRYRLHGGQILWFYELVDARRVLDHAFTEACDTAKKETALPLFMGKPEIAQTT